MTKLLVFVGTLSLAGVLAACGGRQAEPLPTAFPTLSDQAVIESTPTSEPTPTTSSVRPTLPPSWTPTIAPTPTPTSTPTLPPTVDVQPISPVCSTFGPDFANSVREFNLGESPTVSWIAVEGARLYRLMLFNAQQIEILTTLVDGTSYTFDPESFPASGRYGWDVEPLDQFGIQICIRRGDTLLAR